MGTHLLQYPSAGPSDLQELAEAPQVSGDRIVLVHAGCALSTVDTAAENERQSFRRSASRRSPRRVSR
jgi:hydrogenase maturation factor